MTNASALGEEYEFQFTLSRGERRISLDSELVFQLFQFTLSRGERRPSSRPCRSPHRFQFTLSRGERPVKGATTASSI